MDNSSIKQNALTGFIWRFLQQSGTHIVGFVLSMVLARLLSPEDYGLIAMITVFTNIAMVFIHVGFSSAIIQKKDLTETDKNTMFFASLILGLALYLILFLCAPAIASFYNEPRLVSLLRVESLMVLIGAAYSVHHSIIVRELLFKKSFWISACGMAVQSAIGITLALLGFGAWALVFSTLAHNLTTAVIFWAISKWKPKFEFSFASFKGMFFFSLKMLISELFNTVYNNIRSIIIGKQYSSSDLAFYNKGYQFPTLIMTQVDGSMNTVLFSSLSKFQSDWENGLKALRRAMKTSLYICAPFMAGLFAVAKPMILLLLTEKWAESIIYVQLGSIICLFWPLSAQRHALNARGKSGISLKLNFVGKIVSIVILIFTFRISVKTMVLGSIVGSLIMLFINAFFYRKHLEYKFRHQIADILPPILLSALMGAVVYSVQLLNLSNFVTLLIQIPVGIVVYILLSLVFKIDSFYYVLSLIKGLIKK